MISETCISHSVKHITQVYFLKAPHPGAVCVCFAQVFVKSVKLVGDYVWSWEALAVHPAPGMVVHFSTGDKSNKSRRKWTYGHIVEVNPETRTLKLKHTNGKGSSVVNYPRDDVYLNIPSLEVHIPLASGMLVQLNKSGSHWTYYVVETVDGDRAFARSLKDQHVEFSYPSQDVIVVPDFIFPLPQDQAQENGQSRKRKASE